MKINYTPFLFFSIFFAFILPKLSFGQCSGCSPNYTANTATITTSGTTTCITASSGDITITNLTIAASTTLCINASAGNITITNFDLGKSATVNFYSANDKTVTITNYSEGAGTNPRYLNNYGNLKVDANAAGSVVTGWRVFRGVITNSGTINVTNGLEAGGNSSWTNTGTITVGAGMQNNGAPWDNSGTLDITGDFTAASATTFTNTGTWNVSGNNTVNFPLTNGGTMNVGGLLTLNAAGTLNFQGGRVYTYDLILNKGNMTTGTGCAAIVVTNNSNAQANGFLVTMGSVDVTDLSQTHGATPALDANTCPAGPPINCGLTFSNATTTNSCLNNTLPITLLSLKAAFLTDVHVKVDWKIISDELGGDFIVEKTEDLQNFKPVGAVQSSSVLHQEISYEFIDNSSYNSEEVYYRLKQKSQDGSFNILGFVSPIKSESSNKIVSTPNPSNGNFKLSFYSEEKVNSLSVSDQTGSVVYSLNNISDLTLINKDIEIHGPKGIYIVEISTDKGIYYSKLSIQ